VLCLFLAGKTVWFIYFGVGAFGVTQTLSEIASVSLTAYFDKITVKYYCAGTGFGYFFGPLYYTGNVLITHSQIKCGIRPVA
jgi:hypothetical protein